MPLLAPNQKGVTSSLLGVDILTSEQNVSPTSRLIMNIIHDPDVLETENLSSVFEETQQLVFRAVRENQPVHGVEKAIWEQMLLIGHKLLGQFFALSSTGDMGVSVGAMLESFLADES